MSVGIVAVAGSFSVAARAEARARQMALAGLLADEKLAELEGEAAQRVGASEGDFGSDFPGFRWRARLEPSGARDLYRADLSVTWRPSGSSSEKAGRLLVHVVTLFRVGGSE
jgi:hypothetical protein